MCTTNIYTTVYPDGRKETRRVPTLCTHARHGIPCPNNVLFQHPTSYVSHAGKPSSAPTGSPFLSGGGAFPPSPAYTPRSGTPNRSGDESDRSGYRSSSSTRGRRSPAVYINGQRMYEYGTSPSSPSSRPSRRNNGERVVVMDGPPSPRATPPTAFSSPNAAAVPPSSGNPYVVDAQPRTSSSRTNPVVIENTRPLGIDIVDPRDYRDHHHRSSRHHHHSSSSRRSSKHDRHPSNSSYDSSSRHHRREEETEAERDARRRARRERKQREFDEAERNYNAQRHVKWEDRINAANANIANRPAMTPAAPRRSNTLRRGDVDGLTEAVSGMNLGSGSSSRPSRQEMEDEAQKQRLKDRMMRRNTVSGGRRHQVLYDDGTVRWE